MENLGIAGVAAITIICYLIGTAVKATKLDNKWIPIIVGACGAILGVVGMYTMPEFPAKDVLSALAVGVISGLGSTGANQIAKQMSAKGE